MNLLLDTCVLIDFLGGKDPFFQDAQRIMAAGYFRDVRLWVAGQSLRDAFYVLSKYQNPITVQRSLVKASQALSIVSLSDQDFINAARLEWDDYEDCLIALCAQKANAEYIITRDEKGFARSLVPIMTPAGWLTMMKAERGLDYEVTAS